MGLGLKKMLTNTGSVRMLRYFSHIKRHDGLGRLIVEGVVIDKRKWKVGGGDFAEGELKKSECAFSSCWSTCSRPSCIQGGSERSSVLERTRHVTNKDRRYAECDELHHSGITWLACMN